MSEHKNTYNVSKAYRTSLNAHGSVLLCENLEKEKKLLRWKEWQYYSIPKLLHKYPAYQRINPAREYIPRNPGDPELIPYKHKKAYLRALQFRHTDQFHFDSYMVNGIESVSYIAQPSYILFLYNKILRAQQPQLLLTTTQESLLTLNHLLI